MNEAQRKKLLDEEHLFLSGLRNVEPDYGHQVHDTLNDKRRSGTFAYQVVGSIDNMLEMAYQMGKSERSIHCLCAHPRTLNLDDEGNPLEAKVQSEYIKWEPEGILMVSGLNKPVTLERDS